MFSTMFGIFVRPGAHLTKIQLTTIPKAEAFLRAEKKKLTAQLNELEERPLSPPASSRIHNAASPSEDELREGRYFRHASELERLHQINAALERIRQGTYGRCVNCETQIPRKHLEANYAIALCQRCQRL